MQQNVQSKQNETMNTNFLNAKKNLLKFTLLACLALPVVSCSNDDDNNSPVNQNPMQDPLSGYLQAAGFTKSVDVKDSGIYEFGIEFVPTVDGKIKAITAKIPDVHPGMRIIIWDKATKTAIRTETIDVTSAGVEVSKEIAPLQLTKDKEYLFTFNSDDWYNHTKPDATATIYPFTVGDIKVTNYAFISSTASETIFPTNLRNTYYAGDISFKFQKD